MVSGGPHDGRRERFRGAQGELAGHKYIVTRMLRFFLLILFLAPAGCSLLPEITTQPVLHNPFPQLSRVAVAPFFNLSEEPKVDGRQFALAYFNELQLVPGFEVIPVGQVEKAMQDYALPLNSPEDARRIAQVLGADALVVGAVTDFSPYYPPRCAIHVEWYSANPNFHSIPPGYGLPWGTPEEELIPASHVFEAEMALARAQMKTQTPGYDSVPMPSRPPARMLDPQEDPKALKPSGTSRGNPEIQLLAQAAPGGTAAPSAPAAPGAADDPRIAEAPAPWPDARGFIPSPPGAAPPPPWPSSAPVLAHTRTYNGHDAEFTASLSKYHMMRDDARFGGWQPYLERSDDFIRFCCHRHVAEMLALRGGAGETRVVWRWPAIR